MRTAKKQVVVVTRKTHNATQVTIKNPNQKLLSFIEKLAERSKKLKEDIMQIDFKEYKRI